MIAFLLLILLCISLYLLYYFNNKLSLQKRQFILLKKQYDELKNKINKKTKCLDTLIIKYKTPENTSGTIKVNCNLCLYPLDNSIILMNLEEGTFVQIEDCAEINNKIWYEVWISSKDKINSKGWVEEDNIQWTI
ncbi:hypothetical protein BD780_003654 [Clostridium tetanomorphum]|uniref:Uncharacterized protein n=1 Tax=Clostridium tetanomorphum TaxID=1553 RepID=A0A923EAX1_CLOTT|nr:hypothetical protein [Clostridium tetanomorphum]KAJ50840.1 hypothetical protein CTM_15837 [Clostridium tetanomorphum DSM 665]MBC2398331.1 hypothetical protein [Clostridium tetanomorphum]MBP1865483.1 hypothetical protein [Clostridium tetanomorphum]NRS86429.1 hypothetical protein [Clostridium tetanomorphum]NRZ95542.1 hypothetical protein [Clostridium tetanomorphum]